MSAGQQTVVFLAMAALWWPLGLAVSGRRADRLVNACVERFWRHRGGAR